MSSKFFLESKHFIQNLGERLSRSMLSAVLGRADLISPVTKDFKKIKIIVTNNFASMNTKVYKWELRIGNMNWIQKDQAPTRNV